MSIAHKWQKYRTLKSMAPDAGALSVFACLYYQRKYGVPPEAFYQERLYDRREKRQEIISHFDKYTRSWKYVTRHNAEQFPRSWYFFHKIDYFFAGILYPGLDARDYFAYEFYRIRHCQRKTFVTEGGLAKMNAAFNGKGDGSTLSDKAKFNQYFSRFIFRKWIRTEDMTEETFTSFCTGLDKVIVKPLQGTQGKGIYVAATATEEQRAALYEELRKDSYIAEELIRQHPVLAALNPGSVNTIRIYSVWKDGAAHITAAVVRIGGGSAPVDNYHSAGFAVAIDLLTGITVGFPVNRRGERVLRHPVTGQIMAGVEIPLWEDVLHTVREAHALLTELRYIAWDVVVTEDGQITFIEGNGGGGVNIQQQPLLKGLKPLYDSLL